jgi:pentafunctional AROM polypeptide
MGSGIVETEAARKLLAKYKKDGGMVILLSRDIQKVVDYLSIDKTRPAYVDDIMGVWLRRKAWYVALLTIFLLENFHAFSARYP